MYSADEKTRKIQKETIDLLSRFHEICIEYDIVYSLHAGTLLGAVRERGFIPWDDDIDVVLLRENYDRLKEAVEKRANARFYLDESMWTTRLVSINGEGEARWLDIYVYDFISEKYIEQKLKIAIFAMLLGICKEKEEIKATRYAGKYKGVSLLGIWCLYTLGRILPGLWKKKIVEWFRKSLTGEKINIFRSNDRYEGLKIVHDVGVMSKIDLVSFEDRMFYITSAYDTVLRASYGIGYMTPVKEREGQEKAHEIMRNVLSEK